MSTGTAATDYDLAALLDLFKKDIFISLNCHHVGIIEEFDSSNQTARVSIAYKRLVNGEQVDYPVLLDCPVVILGNKTKYLRIPVAAGDECLVLFNDRDIDNWFSSGQIGTLATQRRHNFADAIAMVGIRSLKNSISGWDADYVSVVNGTTEVGAGASKVRIKNSSKDLKGVINALQSIVDQINTALSTFATATGAATTVVEVAAAGTALQSALVPITALLAAYPTAQTGALLE